MSHLIGIHKNRGVIVNVKIFSFNQKFYSYQGLVLNCSKFYFSFTMRHIMADISVYLCIYVCAHHEL